MVPNDAEGLVSDAGEVDEHAALQGHHSHAHGRLSVGAGVGSVCRAFWKPLHGTPHATGTECVCAASQHSP